MNDAQKCETNKIIDWIKDLLLNELDHKTSFGFIRKQNDGYYLERRCSKNNQCNGIWYAHINIYTRKVKVSYVGDCQHFYSKEISKFNSHFIF